MGIFGRSEPDVDDGGLRRRVDELERRVAELEWAVRSAGGQAATPAPPAAGYDRSGPAVSAEVRQLAVEGKKIQAIKVLREQTGLGLKEAKDIVEGLA
jgi:ribosomal protein L7/L12